VTHASRAVTEIERNGAARIDDARSSFVSIRVLSVTPVRAGRLFALASVEIDIDGIPLAVHGIRALNAAGGTRIELLRYRDQNATLRPTISLPEEVGGPIGDAVLR
jgi:hypothetical protein